MKNLKKEPPYIEDIFNKYTKKINIFFKNFFFNKKKNILIIFLIICIWVINGFYFINEPESGIVIRLGKFHHLVKSGLHWKLTLIDKVYAVDVKSIHVLKKSKRILTADGSLINIKMNLKYRITDPVRYLYSMTNPDNSVSQVTDNTLNSVIGHRTIDDILNIKNYITISNDTKTRINKTILPYNMGILITNVKINTTRPPKAVESEFKNVIAAENFKYKYISEAKEYAKKIQNHAKTKAQKILVKANFDKNYMIHDTKNDLDLFFKLLPEYKINKKKIKKLLYIETIEHILNHNRKKFNK